MSLENTAATAPIANRISKAERDFVATAAMSVFPRLAVLGRDAIVGQTDDCVLWTAQVLSVLEGEARAEMNRAREARVSVEKGFVFRHANRFRRELEAIRAEAEALTAKREAERAAKEEAKAKADAEAKALADAASAAAVG